MLSTACGECLPKCYGRHGALACRNVMGLGLPRFMCVSVIGGAWGESLLPCDVMKVNV